MYIGAKVHFNSQYRGRVVGLVTRIYVCGKNIERLDIEGEVSDEARAGGLLSRKITNVIRDKVRPVGVSLPSIDHYLPKIARRL